MTLVAGAICYIIHLYFTLLSVFWVLILLGESSKQNYIFYVKLFLYAVYSEQMEGLKFLRHIYCIKYYTNQTKLSEKKVKVETIEKQQKIKASRKNSFPKIIFDNCTMQTIISPFSFVTLLIGSMWLIFFVGYCNYFQPYLGSTYYKMCSIFDLAVDTFLQKRESNFKQRKPIIYFEIMKQ